MGACHGDAGGNDGSALSQEVERLAYLLFADYLVDVYLAHIAEQGDIDVGARVLLVVVHQGEQLRIVVAGDGGGTIILADVMERLSQLVGGEAQPGGAEIELGHDAVGHGIAMQDGGAL